MKRDMKRILRILRYVRDTADGKDIIDVPDLPNREPELVRYHVGLCIQAGFLNAQGLGAAPLYADYHIWSMTWEGHEFIERHNGESCS